MSSGLPPLDQAFQIGVLLGETPLAQTFLATDAHGQQVVLKSFTPAAAALPGFADRMGQHYLAQSQVPHPNLAPIDHYGTFAGRPVISMPFFRKGSLRSLTDLPDGTRAPLQCNLAIDLIWQAARGVAYAHAAGIIHANLKPSNLLLLAESLQIETRYGFHLLVSDFTIMPPLTVDQVDHDLIAPESRLYALPPEHYDPAGIGQIDARTDIYALGVMLYEALTGAPPFEVATYEDALALHLYDQPSLNYSSRIPENLQPILASCLARQPDDRYQSARALADALEALLPARQRTTRLAADSRSAPDAAVETSPQIRIFRGEERYDQRTYPFDGAGLLIGSGAQCGLRLPDLPDQLVQIDWNGAQVMATVLSDQLAVRIGNIASAVGSTTLWDWDQSLSSGPYLLRLQQPDMLLPLPDPAPLASGAQEIPDPALPIYAAQRSDHLLITVEPAVLAVAPGVESRAILKIENRSATVERLRVIVTSSDSSIERWVRVPNADVTCPGNGEVSLDLIISVPRAPESLAGIHQAKLQVTSLVDRQGRELGENSVRLTNDLDWQLDVQRFVAPTLEMRPKRLSVARSGHSTAFIRNDGNTTEEYVLSGADEPQLIDVETDNDRFSLTPGQAEPVPIVLRPHQLIWYRRTERHDVKMTLASAAPGNEALVTVGVVLDQQPVFKQWQLLLLIALFVLPFLCIFLFGIKTFRPLDRGVSRLPGYSLLNPSSTPTSTATPTPTGLPTATATLDPALITGLVIAPPIIPTRTPAAPLLPAPLLPAQPGEPLPAPTPTTPPVAGAATAVDQPAQAIPTAAQEQATLAPVPDGGVTACLPNVPVLITGDGPAGAPIQLFFNGRRVDRGQGDNPEIPVLIGDDGRFQIVLTVGQEQAGRYPVDVRDVSQDPAIILRSFTCQTAP